MGRRRHLGVSARTIYNWRRQDRIGGGLEPGTTSAELAELTVAKNASANSRWRWRSTDA